MISGKDLIERGWPQGRTIGLALAATERLRSAGVDNDTIIRELEKIRASLNSTPDEVLSTWQSGASPSSVARWTRRPKRTRISRSSSGSRGPLRPRREVYPEDRAHRRRRQTLRQEEAKVGQATCFRWRGGTRSCALSPTLHHHRAGVQRRAGGREPFLRGARPGFVLET